MQSLYALFLEQSSNGKKALKMQDQLSNGNIFSWTSFLAPVFVCLWWWNRRKDPLRGTRRRETPVFAASGSWWKLSTLGDADAANCPRAGR